MSHIETFGSEEDGTEFIAIATQIEAMQSGGSAFNLSPRPIKKRRVREQGPTENDNIDSSVVSEGSYDVQNENPKLSPASLSAACRPMQTDITRHIGPSEDTSDCYMPGELGPQDDTSQKRMKRRIHVPVHGGGFPDMVFTQTQQGLDEDPAKFRGAVWKRPVIQEPEKDSKGDSEHDRTGIAVTRIARHDIDGRFHPNGSHLPFEDDTERAPTQNASESFPLAGPSQVALITQLEDLPSDAFSSSSPEKSPQEDAIELSPQRTNLSGHLRSVRGSRGSVTGFKQMTIFGQPAAEGLTASQAATKRHAWPLKDREEPPTHHALDIEAMKTWVYPTNLGAVRDYQYNIVSRSLFHNTLVALPTGLGKTFIAATVMLNYYRWTTNAQIVFMAPTKPLIAQQMEACYGIVGIPRRDTILMTGETAPAVRAGEWLEKRVFFMTPQTVINDLKTGICDPKNLVLLVVDEAHKATGGFAYTEVIAFIRRFNSSFRVLALTATPGSTVEAVQSVIDNLSIARVELRTEQSLDIREYTHEKLTETETFDFSDEQERIMELFSKALQPAVHKIRGQNGYWSSNPMNLTAFGLTQARQKWMASEAGRKAPMPVKGMMNSHFAVLSSLAHSIGLLKFHGIGPFYSGVLSFQNDVQSGVHKSKAAGSIANSHDFTKMMSILRSWTNNPDFIGHPKMEYLREVVLNHFLDAGEGRHGTDVPPSATRIMVFASYRDSTEEICKVLSRNAPLIRPHVFVGQAASKGQEGMDQKKQNAVIQDFKSGKYNTLIATSIGEEGLDIGTVDLIVCYDASSSPIRMLQRIGRTGRKRVGRVVLLLMKSKEEGDYAKAQDNYLYIQKTIANASKYAYRDSQSPRILPKDIKPVVDKRPVEIPIENSQPLELNEKTRKAKVKAKAKKPAKKFHIPDGVRDGFVRASRLSDGENEAIPKRNADKWTGQSVQFRRLHSLSIPEPPPENAPLPHLNDVLLSHEQLVELQKKYARTADVNSDGIIRAPNSLRFPAKFQNLGCTKYTPHGRKKARLVERTMTAVYTSDLKRVAQFKSNLNSSDIEAAGPATIRLPNSEIIPQPTQQWPSRDAISTTWLSHEPNDQLTRTIKSTRLREPLHQNEPDTGSPTRRRPAVAKELCHVLTEQHTLCYGSAADECMESSPEQTPADMRIGTQGINLGSHDTSGEDEEEDTDSELDGFIAKSSDPFDILSSSQSVLSGSRVNIKTKKPERRISLSSVDEIEESDKDAISWIGGGVEENLAPSLRSKKRRIVMDSDDD